MVFNQSLSPKPKMSKKVNVNFVIKNGQEGNSEEISNIKSMKSSHEWSLRNMEPLMYAAITKMVKDGEVDDILNEKEKLIWRARIVEYTVRSDGASLWNGLKIPTLEQLEQVLQPLHFSGKVHRKDKKMLRKELSDRGFALRNYFGGLERACTLLVN